ncbi:MAG: hypothetical protein H0W23_09370 [Chloroflexia bacterium]|nr:hypothetical protein [Chloroflexia bacterium]
MYDHSRHRPIPLFALRRSLSRVVAITLLGALLVASLVAGNAAAQNETATPQPLAGEDDLTKPCFDGHLRIRDLEDAQETLTDGFAEADAVAKAWKPDARLVTLRLGCPLLETGYQWEGTYFSESAQAYFETDTRVVQATEDNPKEIPTLDSATVQVSPVYRSLLRAGYDEASQLGVASGLTIRPSTDAEPFGPPSAPRDDVYFHVSIEERGQVIDVWIAARDATIYRYEVR